MIIKLYGTHTHTHMCDGAMRNIVLTAFFLIIANGQRKKERKKKENKIKNGKRKRQERKKKQHFLFRINRWMAGVGRSIHINK